MTASQASADRQGDFSLALASATIAAPALLAIWLGLRDQGIGSMLGRIAWLLLVVVVAGWFVRQHRAREFVGVAPKVAPFVVGVSIAMVLPHQPQVSAVASAAVAGLASLAMAAAIHPAFARRVSAVFAAVATAVVIAGNVAVAEIASPGEPAPQPGDTCIAAAQLDISPDVAQQIERALAREGGEAGCIVMHLFTAANGIEAVLTTGGYLVLGWENRPLRGPDGAPNAAVVWANAFTAIEASSLLDHHRPADRMMCDSGAFILLVDDDGLVRSIVASDDYKTWEVVPEVLMNSYIDLARSQAVLPVPTGRFTNTEGIISQQVDVTGVIASTASSELEDVEFFRARCTEGN